MDLSGKTALVTGSNSGIGAEVARLLAEAGASVVIHYSKNEKGAEEVAGEINSKGGKAIVLKADLRSEEEIEELVKSTVSQLGGIDFLVNNAAAFNNLGLASTDLEEFSRIIDIDVKGTFLFCKHAVPEILKRGKGAVVTVASAAGTVGGAGGFAYTCAKHALIGLTRQLTFEYGTRGIRANAVSPGLINTNMVADAFAIPEFVQMMSSVPAGRPGQPRDVANVVLFLLSDEADFIQGENILVDGGLIKHFATQFNAVG
jgi:3-oxoacyl-[acyl-carrier protein] reductase